VTGLKLRFDLTDFRRLVPYLPASAVFTKDLGQSAYIAVEA
jgi:hypothetical protein